MLYAIVIVFDAAILSDENGNLKWISREKPGPINQNVFYQPIQSVLPAVYIKKGDKTWRTS